MPQLLGRFLLLLCIALAAPATSAEEITPKKTAAQLLDRAAGLQRAGRLELALVAYNELLEHSLSGPLREQLLRRIARLYYRLAQYEPARALFQKQLQEFPEGKHAAEALAMLAWTQLALGEADYAGKSFLELHEKFPQSAQAPDAAYWLAVAAADDEDSVTALEYANWLIQELSPDEQRSSERLSQLWHRGLCLKCQLAAQMGQWQAIQDLITENRSKLEEGADRTKVLFWLAESEFRTKQFDNARQQFAELQPLTIGIGESWVAMVPLRRAQLAARRQQWTEVLKQLDKLEEKFPDFALRYEVDYLRGRAQAGRGEMTAARRSYRRVLENQAARQTETAARAQWMIGETFFHQHDYPRAEAAYSKVMQYEEESDWQARAALQAGKCWELQAGWEEAREVYRSAIERWRTSESTPQLQARLNWTEKQLLRR